MKNTILIILAIMLLSCSKDDGDLDKFASKDSLLIKQYLGQKSNIWRDEGNTVLTKSIDGVKTMMMITDTLVNNSGNGTVIFDPLKLYMYDSLGAEKFNVSSFHGVSEQKKFITIATGDVVLESKLDNKIMLLYSDSLVFMQNRDEVFTYPVHIKIFTKNLDTVLYVIKANRGVWNLKTLKSNLEENVIIDYKKDNVELLCEDLLFDSKEDIVKSKGHVKFKRISGDYVEGDGFESDSKFKHWKLKKNIKAEIFDFNVDGSNL